MPEEPLPEPLPDPLPDELSGFSVAPGSCVDAGFVVESGVSDGFAVTFAGVPVPAGGFSVVAGFSVVPGTTRISGSDVGSAVGSGVGAGVGVPQGMGFPSAPVGTIVDGSIRSLSTTILSNPTPRRRNP